MSEDRFSNSRRDFVHGLIGLIPAVAVGGSFVTSPTQAATAVAASAAATYVPKFFSAEETAFINAACERLIPSDENGPGALELNVLRFIDLQMETPYGHGKLWYMEGPFQSGPPTLGYQLPLAPRELYRQGIAAAEKWVQAQHGKRFADLDASTRDAVLTAFESGKADFGDLPADTFFAQLLQNTIEGAFADPIHGGNTRLGGWKMIGFPGARADFADWSERGEPYPLGAVSISGETSKP
jgi:gluconate 2-dehydrogenase gamma chain